MENNFFMPVGKMVSIIDTNNILVTGKFQGFVTFGAIPSIFLSNDLEGDTKNEIIIPINQVVNFSVVKPKNILL